jgi:hypothetical protein
MRRSTCTSPAPSPPAFFLSVRDDADARLKLVSRCARSVFLDLESCVTANDGRWRLCIAGIAPSVSQIANFLGEDADALKGWLIELQRVGLLVVEGGEIDGR